MKTLPDRVLESGLPLGNHKSLQKAVRKVVVIQVKSRSDYDLPGFGEDRAYSRGDEYEVRRNTGRVLGTKVIDAKDGRVAFWFIKRDAGEDIGFEFSFLQGAVAAIVLMELSDRETIQDTKDLLREICKGFSIPVMLVVGGNIGEDLIRWETPLGLGEIASKVVSFADAGRKTVIPAC